MTAAFDCVRIAALCGLHDNASAQSSAFERLIDEFHKCVVMQLNGPSHKCIFIMFPDETMMFIPAINVILMRILGRC